MREIKSSKTYKDNAKAAAAKPAVFGDDIDLSTYVSSTEAQPYQADPTQLPAQAREQMLGVGVILDDMSQRSGTFIQMDNAPVHSSVRQEGIEVIATSQALEKYDWWQGHYQVATG